MAQKKNVVVLGGGVAGLAVAYYLLKSGGFSVTVLEREPVTGGVCGSFEHDGFVLDYGAHKMYSVIPGVMDEFRDLMGSGLLEVRKKNRIYLRGRLLDYPLKLGNVLAVLGAKDFLRLGLGYAWSSLKGLLGSPAARSYEDYMQRVFGSAAYALIFRPLADKVWGEPATLHSEMGRTRVPSSNALEVALKLLGLKKETSATNAEYFLYPAAGFRAFPDALAREIVRKRGVIYTNARIAALPLVNGRVSAVKFTVDGQERELPCDTLVSTIPLKSLDRLLGLGRPSPVDKLQPRHVVLVYLVINKPLVLQDQWLFFPEEKYIFSRIFEQKQMLAALGAPERTVICCDFTCDAASPKWTAADTALASRCADDLAAAGFVQRGDITGSVVRRFTDFYPRYDLRYQETLGQVFDRFAGVPDLVLTGRLGMYNYNNADHCLDMGRVVAEGLYAGRPAAEVMATLKERAAGYRIVD
ncbi:MAG: FAD-dependent oxidoreductase [Candidatus Omnitrophica bacterium]|nr:FAD-dependent oxidoreductase [Candidatus Omnitrophota bacterium]